MQSNLNTLMTAQPSETPKRFTTRRQSLEFYIDDDLFRGVPALPAFVAMGLLELHSQLEGATGQQRLKGVMKICETFMTDESYQLLESRLYDKTNPIDLDTLMEVLQWLIGEGYSLRPTRNRSSSEAGQIASGPSSTGGAQHAESILEISAGTDS